MSLLDARVRRHPGFVARTILEQQLLVPAAGAPPGVLLFLLDGPVAQLLWEELAQPRSGHELVARVCELYAVEQAEAERDVATFLAQLRAAGCLEDAPAP